MGESHQNHRQHIMHRNKLLDVFCADLDQTRKHEVVCESEELQEEADALFRDEEVVRVQILYDAVEEQLWNPFDLDQEEISLLVDLSVLTLDFLKHIVSREHHLEVLAAASEHTRVGLDVVALNLKHNVKELIDVHADLHLFKRKCL
jgi:2-phospho-L-lactate guanylyltransferase (CobY/MobA/RfbA family)